MALCDVRHLRREHELSRHLEEGEMPFLLAELRRVAGEQVATLHRRGGDEPRHEDHVELL